MSNLTKLKNSKKEMTRIIKNAVDRISKLLQEHKREKNKEEKETIKIEIRELNNKIYKVTQFKNNCVKRIKAVRNENSFINKS